MKGNMYTNQINVFVYFQVNEIFSVADRSGQNIFVLFICM